jgi:hypothetical protein
VSEIQKFPEGRKTVDAGRRGKAVREYGGKGIWGKDKPHLLALVIPDAACRKPESSKKEIPLQTVKA